MSPFGEKVRLAFGLKGLAWRSVETPIWPPRPDTVPLTAGYRRSPVLQIGADVYCDTLLIFRELERRYPEPTLYPDGQTGLAAVLSWWADTTTFIPAASIATSIIATACRPNSSRTASPSCGMTSRRPPRCATAASTASASPPR
ncbi:glutathione S-transferase family protein [Aureimonas phyllosphaerae]|uniref:glutathione S-transferase family protein n=1 Tax=Aureimonas phyllosphaerae TaxID=1166078 RepID=UPI003A5C27D5